MTPGRGPVLLILALACALGPAGCSNPAALTTPAAGQPRPVTSNVPPGWSRMRPMFAHAEALAALGDTAGLLAYVPSLKAEGLGLLKSSVPNLLPRHELPRFLEARAAFGDALVRLSQAHEEGRAADLPALVTRLADAWRGWMSVISGQAPERAV